VTLLKLSNYWFSLTISYGTSWLSYDGLYSKKYLYIGIVKCVIGSQNKIKRKQKYHTVGTIPKSNRKIVEREKITTHNSHVHGWGIK
jgi:hypothetical protein